MLNALIYGTGAVGSYIAGEISKCGVNVYVKSRGDQLQAIRNNGLRVFGRGMDYTIKPHLVGDAKSPEFDLLFITLKAHQIEESIEDIRQYAGSETSILPVINGLPWWYFAEAEGSMHNYQIKACEANGLISRLLPSSQVIGVVPYVGVEIIEPGVVKVFDGYNELHLGEALNHSQFTGKYDAKAVSALFQETSITWKAVENIRLDVWKKLLGNLSTNPISVVYNMLINEMFENPETTSLIRNIMSETNAIALKLGIDIGLNIEERMRVIAQLGAFKTSMLQDYEKGRKMEIEPIIGSVLEVADKLGINLPSIRELYSKINRMESKPSKATA